MKIGARIQQRRKELNMTQEILAEKLEVSTQAISSWENGLYIPETGKLPVLAQALSTTIGWLMDEETDSSHWEFHDEMYSLERMYSQVKIAVNALELKQSARALVLMKKYHEGQTRKGKDKVPYIAHPLLIACHALALGLKEDELIATALLHDVLEDTDATPDELDVSLEVIEAVKLVSYSCPEGMTSKEAKKLYYDGMYGNKIAAIVKILDRCNNVSHMAAAFSKEKLIEYIDETEEYVFPLIEHVKHNYLEYYNAVFLLKYQMLSVMETMKRLL